MQIYLMRHGECLDNARDVINGRRNSGLTNLGKKQAHDAAKKLASAKIKIIVASPLKRTRQTAAIVKKDLALSKVLIEPDLVERGLGVFSGKSSQTAERLAAKIFSVRELNYILSGKGVESFPAVQRRARRVWKKIKKFASQQGNVLVVAHGDLIMMLRSVVRGWTWQRALQESYPVNGEIIIFKL